MGVGHGASADKPSPVSRRTAAACAGLAVALVLLVTSVAFAVFDSDDEFPWFVVAIVVGALMLLGIVFALLTIWRADEGEPYYLR
jgi:Na+/melibiose symporter-like transporter